MELPSPSQLKKKYPLPPPIANAISEWRNRAKDILQGKDSSLIAIVGPCSIHDPASALEYAQLLKKFSQEVDKTLFPIMRLFIEKPRTRLGWKGILYDPHLDGSDDIAKGLEISRKLFLEIAELGVPCASEILEPLTAPYLDDLLVWGSIGARTAASQPHRQMASGLPFPVGFKNDLYGELDNAISGIVTARTAQSHIGINCEGKIAALKTRGNPLSHLVLRGANHCPNYDPLSIARAISLLKKNHLESQILIDCSHGNSNKDPRRQQIVLESVMAQRASGNEAIKGFMLESHLFPGKQPLSCDPSLLRYGVSITDPCLGWSETEILLSIAAERSMSIHSVQK
ncbi:MAG: 3-deoxy-7-phosphoheptulonate synthase [Chlamydiota bacterium]